MLDRNAFSYIARSEHYGWVYNSSWFRSNKINRTKWSLCWCASKKD